MAILVIDDEQFIQDLAQKILTRAGYKTLLAASGKEAVSVFESNKNDIQLILLDYNLKDITGIDVLRIIRESANDLVCIVSSGSAFSITDLPEDLSPNTHFLQKPYRANQLSELVAQLLK